MSLSDGSPAPQTPKHIPSMEEDHLAKQLLCCKTVPAPDLLSPLPQIVWDLFEKIIPKFSVACSMTTIFGFCCVCWEKLLWVAYQQTLSALLKTVVDGVEVVSSYGQSLCPTTILIELHHFQANLIRSTTVKLNLIFDKSH
ncbi:unnamed protein product [Brassica oleracea]